MTIVKQIYWQSLGIFVICILLNDITFAKEDHREPYTIVASNVMEPAGKKVLILYLLFRSCTANCGYLSFNSKCVICVITWIRLVLLIHVRIHQSNGSHRSPLAVVLNEMKIYDVKINTAKHVQCAKRLNRSINRSINAWYCIINKENDHINNKLYGHRNKIITSIYDDWSFQ